MLCVPVDRTDHRGKTHGVSLLAPHPAFVAHFTDPLYEDTSVETAPFGSDEGADLLWEWGRRRGELRRDATIADLMGTDQPRLDGLVGTFSGIDYLDQAALVRGAAFTLLRLIGHLSGGDRVLVSRSLDYEIETTADPSWLPLEVREQLLPALRTQRADLLSWANPAE